MAEKVTTMVLNVDLRRCRCYKKVKKILCQFPQIRDQKYDKEANTVTITVVCCSPEKIRDKICCKGGDCIISITIISPEPPIPEPEKKIELKNEVTVNVECCCTTYYPGHVLPTPCCDRPVYRRCGCGCGGYQYCYASGGNPEPCSIL